jgi:hypothetical protein
MRKPLLSDVSREELERLYNDELMTTAEIGKIYGVSGEIVRLRMIRFGIPRRGTPWSAKDIRSQLDHNTMGKLYVNERLSMAEIGKQIGVSETTIHSRLKKFNITRRDLSTASIRYPRYDFSGDTIEKAYLYGFRQGDLWVRLTNEGPFCASISVACVSSRYEQVNLFQRLFSSYGHVSVSSGRKGKHIQYSLQCCLNLTFDFLLHKENFIPAWILDDTKLFIPYLAGYVDAEGSFRLMKDGTSRFFLGSCDVMVIHQIQEVLTDRYGVEVPDPRLSIPKGHPTGRIYKSKSDFWSIQIGKKNSLYRLCTLLDPYLIHEKRRTQMSSVLENVIARGVQENK